MADTSEKLSGWRKTSVVRHGHRQSRITPQIVGSSTTGKLLLAVRIPKSTSLAPSTQFRARLILLDTSGNRQRLSHLSRRNPCRLIRTPWHIVLIARHSDRSDRLVRALCHLFSPQHTAFAWKQSLISRGPSLYRCDDHIAITFNGLRIPKVAALHSHRQHPYPATSNHAILPPT
ncbi:hypothetical protein BDW02DRAFT_403768 [Decorospora gaudefroyi]|uniref:Uncharacterized protein n=1 Tax=Decorospora gaudefroyi TaxID=184978 RepID=A0A6A5K5H5_9PLEO|nr:hypothetical protein BDW02DRAFT_403768 [Decorospora gaudefroyi]